MKEKYESPELKGPIECMKGTIGFTWPTNPGKYVAPEINGPIECMKGTIGFTWTDDTKLKVAYSQNPVQSRNSLQFRDEEFGMMVYNPLTEGLYECNKTAAIIIKMLNGVNTKADIVAAIEKNFKAEQNTVKDDVEQFIKKHLTHKQEGK
jgi:hypothetical protein